MHLCSTVWSEIAVFADRVRPSKLVTEDHASLLARHRRCVFRPRLFDSIRLRYLILSFSKNEVINGRIPKLSSGTPHIKKLAYYGHGHAPADSRGLPNSLPRHARDRGRCSLDFEDKTRAVLLGEVS